MRVQPKKKNKVVNIRTSLKIPFSELTRQQPSFRRIADSSGQDTETRRKMTTWALIAQEHMHNKGCARAGMGMRKHSHPLEDISTAEYGGINKYLFSGTVTQPGKSKNMQFLR